MPHLAGTLKVHAFGADFFLTHCPVAVFATRGEGIAPGSTGGAASADTEVETVEIGSGHTDEAGAFSIALRGLERTDQLAVQFVLEDTGHKIVVKQAFDATRPYTLRRTVDNPRAPGYAAPEGGLIVEPAETPWPGSTAQEREHGTNAAMAYAVLVALNRWFDANRSVHGQAALPAIVATYPNPHGSRYHAETTEVQLNRGEQDIHPTIIAHEYGHHIFKNALNGYSVGGDHSVVTRVERSDGTFEHTEEYITRAAADAAERTAFRRQLAIDCSEGYASALACEFFNSPTYRGRFNVENLTARSDEGVQDASWWCAGLGDLFSAGYIWDLCDAPTGDDTVQIPFFEVHRHLIAWGAGLGTRKRLLAGFHRYLKAHTSHGSALDSIARRNTLRFDLLIQHGIVEDGD